MRQTMFTPFCLPNSIALDFPQHGGVLQMNHAPVLVKDWTPIHVEHHSLLGVPGPCITMGANMLAVKLFESLDYL